MEEKSITALISAFSRAYHAENNKVKIFDDSIARRLLTEEEYRQISKSMAEGIEFFNPSFKGTPDEALRWVVDNQLSPSPLGRAVFTEKALQTAVSIGAKQYLIFGAGYDTFAYRQPVWANEIQIFEIDHPSTANDKKMRLKNSNITIPDNVQYITADFMKQQWQMALTQNIKFNKNRISFRSILGVTYYLSVQTFVDLISAFGTLLPVGSSVVFDYPDENSCSDKTGERAKKQTMLAGAAKEKMLAGYSCEEMENILSSHGFLIYEQLTPMEMTRQYFEACNHASPLHPMTAFDNVNYCLAVRK